MFELFKPDFEAILLSVPPTCLGHFEKVGPLWKRNIMSSYWPSDISKSKSAGKQGTKRHKSRFLLYVKHPI